MPAFVSVAEHECCSGDDFPDEAGINETAALLVSAAEKCIRRAAGAQTFFFCFCQNFLGALPVEAERFFAVNVFSRFKCAQVDFSVRLRSCEIQDDCDFRICEDLLHGACLDSVLRGPVFRRFSAQIGARCDHDLLCKDRCILQVDAADVAASDQPDFQHKKSFR